MATALTIMLCLKYGISRQTISDGKTENTSAPSSCCAVAPLTPSLLHFLHYLKMRAFPFLACIIALAVGIQSPFGVENRFLPDSENCTKNLLELLLWQHGLHVVNLLEAEKASGATLETISNILLEIKEIQEAVRDQNSPISEVFHHQNKTCEPPFTKEGSHCLLLAPHERMNWADARQYCISRGGELVVMKEANIFAELLRFIWKINSVNTVNNVWIGGSDEEVEGVWRWIDGDLMPEGAPFWGSVSLNTEEPRGGRVENCAILYKPNNHYFHDISCSHKASPFCEKK
ncbi:hypothetical protein O3P69_012782 [Scylla paramamosain]|uniref:C-type lectin domain-containing protein n=1 Tax=Scylla paramamosain TaxID=85552 RepID=A0AAW0SKI0_SCYPA